MAQYDVLKQEECGCKWELTKRFPRGCPDCKGSGIRTRHVPLIDVLREMLPAFILEIEDAEEAAVEKEPGVYSFTCNVCGHIRDHATWTLMPNTYIRCPICCCQTFHTPSVCNRGRRDK